MSFSVKRLLRIGISIENWRGGAWPNNNSTLNTTFLSFFYFSWFFLSAVRPLHQMGAVVTPSAVSRTRLNQTNTCENAEHWIIVFRTWWVLPRQGESFHQILNTSLSVHHSFINYLHKQRLPSKIYFITFFILPLLLYWKNYYYYYFFKKYCCRVWWWCINNNILCIIF